MLIGRALCRAVQENTAAQLDDEELKEQTKRDQELMLLGAEQAKAEKIAKHDEEVAKRRKELADIKNQAELNKLDAQLAELVEVRRTMPTCFYHAHPSIALLN